MIDRSFAKIPAFILCAFLLCSFVLAGCAENDELDADKIRQSLETSLSALDEERDTVADSIAGSIDSESLEDLGMSTRDIAGKVMESLNVEVVDVMLQDDIAVAEVNITCKDIPSVSSGIRALAEKYSTTALSEDQIIEQMTKESDELINNSELKVFGPIYLEYSRTNDGWVLTEESRQRMCAQIVEGSS